MHLINIDVEILSSMPDEGLHWTEMLFSFVLLYAALNNMIPSHSATICNCSQFCLPKAHVFALGTGRNLARCRKENYQTRM